MKLSYVLVALVLVALLAAVFASGFFVGSTYAPYLATSAYGPNMMARGFAAPNGMMPGYRPGTGMMSGLGRGLGTGRVNRGFSMLGGFFPGIGLLGLGARFLIPLAFLALIVLVVILLMRRPQPVVVAPAAPANPPATTNPPAETNQV
jgi:hypothetical protein